VINNYNLLGQLTSVTDSAGVGVTHWYNNQGLLVVVSNAFGLVQSTTYDIEDRITNSVDANGVTITNLYDDLGRLRARGYQDGGVEKFGYSARGLIAYTNQIGASNFFAYDAAGRKIAETNANNEANHFTYSPAGDLTQLEDGRQKVTLWKYNQFGQVTNKSDEGGVRFTYKYDADGRLTNRWTPAKTNTFYAYDAVGNLTDINYAASTNIHLRYDALNRLTNMVDAAGTTKYSYTNFGALLSEDGPWDNDTVNYTYENRRRSGLSLLQPNASPWSQSFGYDGANRLTSVASPAGSFGYGYDSTRQMQVGKLNLPNGAYITNTFDTVARLLSTSLKNSTNGILNSHRYGYNVASQRTAVTNTAGNRLAYTYDKIGQLKTAYGFESNGTARLHEKFGYEYDAANNLKGRTNNALIQSFTISGNNQLDSVSRSGTLTVAGTTTSSATNVTVNTSNAVLYSDATFASTNHNLVNGTNPFTAIAADSLGRRDTNISICYLPTPISLAYDLNGNLRTNGTRIFEYDDENQLTRITEANAWKSEFTYDGKMRRRIRKEYSWQGSAWVLTNEVRYVYDGNLVIQERDGFNLPTVSYTRGKDLSGSLEGAGGIGGLLARTDHSSLAPGHSFYHSDGNGNVTMLINSQQLAVAKYLYDSFGNILSLTGPLADANLYRFSTKEYHLNSGLSYYLRRFYEPNLQRWLNRDPIGEAGGINLYGYVGNSPPNRIDPLGLDYGWPVVPPPGYPPTFPPPPPKPPQYPQGFSLCQRDLQKDSSCDCPTMIGNALGGEHSYLQYVDSEGNKWGYGWGGGPKGAPEGAFNPNSCKPCKANSNPLKYGSGAGKAANSASTAEIQDCIKNNPPTKPYSSTGYNCRSWAKEAAKNCGLDCN
jgi:RHS repeat-associated protein